MDLRTVAVFGASGKLGRHVLRVLASRGLTVRALVHRTPLNSSGVTCLTGSIADREAVRSIVEGADAVVQLATAKEDASTFFDVSLRGTWNVLEASRRAGVGQVVLFSGDAAQGIWFYPQPEPIDESHPLSAYPGHYAFSKVMEETMARQFAIQYGLPVSILRASWVFEDDDLLRHFSLLENSHPAEPGHGIGVTTADVRALVERGEDRLTILTDAAGAALKRHVVHMDDVIQAFDRILGNPVAVGRDYNIAAAAPFHYDVAADYLSQRLGVPTVAIPTAYHGFEIKIDRARRELAYEPANDFHLMADRAIAAWSAKSGDHSHA